MDEFTITLNIPLTEEEFDMITDVDFERTDRVWFHTKHGKKVEFVKKKKGRWAYTVTHYPYCSECGWMPEEDEMLHINYYFCPGCGADMRERGDQE